MSPPKSRRGRAEIRTMSDSERTRWKALLSGDKAIWDDAEERTYVRISQAIEAGLTWKEVGEALGGVADAVVGRWKAKGEEARSKRRGEDSQPPGKRGSDG